MKSTKDYCTLALKRGLIWYGKDIISTTTKTMWKCKECGYTWSSSYHTINKGAGCPACNKAARIRKTSKPASRFHGNSFASKGLCSRRICLNPGNSRGEALMTGNEGEKGKMLCKHCYSVVHPIKMGKRPYNPDHFNPNTLGGHGFCNVKTCANENRPALATMMMPRINNGGKNYQWIALCVSCAEGKTTRDKRSDKRYYQKSKLKKGTKHNP